MPQTTERPIGADLKKLRKLSVAEDCMGEFLRGLKRLLAEDFDETFEYVKTQKLLTKSRSAAHVEKLSADLETWASGAALSGKRRARLIKHLRICKRVQDLFCEIDRKSSTLTAWSADTDALMLSILSRVELVQEQSNQEAEEENSLFERRTPMQYIERFNAIRAEPRRYCDAANLLLQEVARRGSHEGAPPAEEEIRTLFQLASEFATIETMFDNYSFQGWRVDVSAEGLAFIPSASDFLKARHWAVQRVNAADDVEFLDARDEFAKLMTGGTSEDRGDLANSFEAFLTSDSGLRVLAKAQRVSLLVNNRMTRNIEEVFDVDSQLATESGVFSIRDLLKVWSFLLAVTFSARYWIKHTDPQSTEAEAQALVPRTSCKFLEDLMLNQAGLPAPLATAVLEQFSTRLDGDRKVDLLLRPLLKLRSGDVALPLTYLETSRFDRNVFKIAINESRVNLSLRGLKPLIIIAKHFKRAQFQVRMNVAVREEHNVVTDVDLVLLKDGRLFLGQVKIVVQPDTCYEMWQVRQKLADAARQLKRAITALERAGGSLTDHLGLGDGQKPTDIVPFILTNVWDFTGAAVAGFPVVDLSYLTVLISGGVIRSGTRNEMHSLKLIHRTFPSGPELAALIRKSLHRAMFRQPKIQHVPWMIGGQKILVPSRFL
jgi:hypothetical protein